MSTIKSVTYRIFLFWSALFWPDESLEYSCTHIYLIFYRFHILWVCWCHKPNGAYRFVKSCSTDHNKLITNAQYITPTFLSGHYFTWDLHISGSSNNTTCRLIWLFTISVRYINQLILILIATFNSFTRQSRYNDKMQKGIFDATFILEESLTQIPVIRKNLCIRKNQCPLCTTFQCKVRNENFNIRPMRS